MTRRAAGGAICRSVVQHKVLLFNVFYGCSLLIPFLALFILADHVREFTCGKLFYRTFHLDEERDALFVGAM